MAADGSLRVSHTRPVTAAAENAWSPTVRWVISAVGGFFAAVTVAAGTRPGPMLERLDGGISLWAVVLACLVVAGERLLHVVPGPTWAWAVPIGLVVGLAELAGTSLQTKSADLAVLSIHQPLSSVAWSVCHLLGVAYGTACLVAWIFVSLDRNANGANRTEGWITRTLARVRDRPLVGWMALAGLLVVSRIPYLVLVWPGILPFDSVRAIAYLHNGVWDQLDPIGHSLLVATLFRLGHLLGWGDVGGLAIGAVLQVVTSCAAFAFLLARMAVWRVDARIWLASVAWVVLVPAFGVFSVTVLKDVRFTSAFVVLVTCLAELTFGRTASAARWWPWLALAASGVVLMVMRTNGQYVLVPTLVALLVFHRGWHRVTAVAATWLIGFGLYTYVLIPAMPTTPTRASEPWSVPLQQVARIARDHGPGLRPDQQAYVRSVWPKWTVTDVGDKYRPGLSDPVKDSAAGGIRAMGTGPFLRGWIGLAADYPGTAATATLAATVGYWAPGSSPWPGHGVGLDSHNEARGVRVDVPAGRSEHGLRGALERSAMLGDGLLRVPGIGLVASPAVIVWIWILTAVAAVRRRDWVRLVAFVPAAFLMVTVLAGPVSGSMRYVLPLYATVPVAVCAMVLATREDQRLRNSQR